MQEGSHSSSLFLVGPSNPALDYPSKEQHRPEPRPRLRRPRRARAAWSPGPCQSSRAGRRRETRSRDVCACACARRSRGLAHAALALRGCGGLFLLRPGLAFTRWPRPELDAGDYLAAPPPSLLAPRPWTLPTRAGRRRPRSERRQREVPADGQPLDALRGRATRGRGRWARGLPARERRREEPRNPCLRGAPGLARGTDATRPGGDAPAGGGGREGREGAPFLFLERSEPAVLPPPLQREPREWRLRRVAADFAARGPPSAQVAGFGVGRAGRAALYWCARPSPANLFDKVLVIGAFGAHNR